MSDKRLARFGVKMFRHLVGMVVRVRRQLETRGGVVFPVGTVMTITGTWRGRIDLGEGAGFGYLTTRSIAACHLSDVDPLVARDCHD